MSSNNIPSWQSKLNEAHKEIEEYSELTSNHYPLYSIDLHDIAKGLLEEAQNHGHTNKQILNKVDTLADRQLKYYKSSKFHVVERFFSSLRNLLTLGTFHSSAYLASKLAKQLQESHEIQEIPEKGEKGENLTKPQKPLIKSKDTIIQLQKKEHIQINSLPPESSDLKDEETALKGTLKEEESALNGTLLKETPKEVEEKVNVKESPKTQELRKSLLKPVEKEEKPEIVHEVKPLSKAISKKDEFIQELFNKWRVKDNSALNLNSILEALFVSVEIEKWSKTQDGVYTVEFNKAPKGAIFKKDKNSGKNIKRKLKLSSPKVIKFKITEQDIVPETKKNEKKEKDVDIEKKETEEIKTKKLVDFFDEKARFSAEKGIISLALKTVELEGDFNVRIQAGKMPAATASVEQALSLLKKIAWEE